MDRPGTFQGHTTDRTRERGTYSRARNRKPPYSPTIAADNDEEPGYLRETLTSSHRSSLRPGLHDYYDHLTTPRTPASRPQSSRSLMSASSSRFSQRSTSARASGCNRSYCAFNEGPTCEKPLGPEYTFRPKTAWQMTDDHIQSRKASGSRSSAQAQIAMMSELQLRKCERTKVTEALLSKNAQKRITKFVFVPAKARDHYGHKIPGHGADI